MSLSKWQKLAANRTGKTVPPAWKAGQDFSMAGQNRTFDRAGRNRTWRRDILAQGGQSRGSRVVSREKVFARLSRNLKRRSTACNRSWA